MLRGVSFQAAVVTDVGVPYGLPTEIALRNRRAKAKLFRKVVPGGRGGGQRRRPARRDPGRREPRRPPRRASAWSVRTEVDVSARIERLDAAGSRFVLHGFDRDGGGRAPADRPAAGRPRPGRRRPGLGAGDRRSTPSSPGSRRSPTSPAAWRPSTRARTSTSGSTRPQTAAALGQALAAIRAVSAPAGSTASSAPRGTRQSPRGEPWPRPPSSGPTA